MHKQNLPPDIEFKKNININFKNKKKQLSKSNLIKIVVYLVTAKKMTK